MRKAIPWLFVIAVCLCAVTGSRQDFTLGTSPGNPNSGKVRLWANTSTGNLECLNSSGASCFASGGGIYLYGTCNGSAVNSTTTGMSDLGIPSSGTCGTAVNTSAVAFAAPITKSCTLQNLFVSSATAGNSGSDGVATVQTASANGTASTTAVTCTIGTGTSCNDSTHTASVSGTVSAPVMVMITVAPSTTTSIGYMAGSVQCN